MGHLGPPGWLALGEPVGHRPAVPPVDLGQQPLDSGDVDQAGVPAIDPDPFPGGRVGLPLGFAPAGLVNAEHRHRRRFGVEHRIRGDHHLVARCVPAAAVVGGDRGHRAVFVEDLGGHHRLGPRGDPGPRRHPGDRFGEHLAVTHHAGAQPLPLTPPRQGPVWADPRITRGGHHPAFRAGRALPAPGADPDPLRGGPHHHKSSAVNEASHRLDDHTVEIEQK